MTFLDARRLVAIMAVAKISTLCLVKKLDKNATSKKKINELKRQDVKYPNKHTAVMKYTTYKSAWFLRSLLSLGLSFII